MDISFDVWGTLITASPEFKAAKRDLVRKYSPLKDLSNGTIDATFHMEKKRHDTVIELYGNQPDNFTLFCTLCKSFDITPNKMVPFISEYNGLFLEHLPSVFEETKSVLEGLVSDGHKLYISSNTLFIEGKILEKALLQLGLLVYFKNYNFSDQMGRSKPSREMFLAQVGTNIMVLPDYHIGDIRITGSHEHRIQQMIDHLELECDYMFMYFAELTSQDVSPELEHHLNFNFIKSILDIDWIIKNDKFVFNTRVVKYIISVGHEEFKSFINYQSEVFRDTLYKYSISNGYHKHEQFQENLEYLNKITLAINTHKI